MPSSRSQILALTTLPLLAFALPQPQADTWGGAQSEAAGAGAYTWGEASPSAGSGQWAAQTPADTWGATTTPADAWAATTAAPALASQPAESPYNPSAWLTQVTYPAGCEQWANPCPSGAIIAGGGSVATPTDAATWDASAPFSNANTIYTTQTNSVGIITGMPSVGAGVTEGSSMVTSVSPVVAPSSSSSTSINVFGANATNTPSATTSSGFAQETTNSAAGLKASAALCAIVAVVAAFL